MKLVYPGCLFRYNDRLKKIYQAFKRKLEENNIRIFEMNEIECCGNPLRAAGYKQDFLTVAKKNAVAINAAGVKEIITLCPECNRVFEKHYKRDTELRSEVQIKHVTIFLSKIIEHKGNNGSKVSYQDPCFLGRRSGIYEEPRELIKNLGYKLVEVEENRENSICCGAGGNVRDHYPELSHRIAMERLIQFKKTGCQHIVTACPRCYINLSGKGESIKSILELY